MVQKTIEGKEVEIDAKSIKAKATKFVAKEFERDNYPLVKKEDIEGSVFLVFNYNQVKDEDGRSYYNFKCLNKNDKPFCFNGSNILAEQVEENGFPCWVKLIRKEKPGDKLRPYYWVFTNPE